MVSSSVAEGASITRARPKVDRTVVNTMLPSILTCWILLPLCFIVGSSEGGGFDPLAWKIAIPIMLVVWCLMAWFTMSPWGGYVSFGRREFIISCDEVSPIAHVRFDDIVMIEARVMGGGAPVVGALSDRTGVVRGVELYERVPLAERRVYQWSLLYPVRRPEVELMLEDGSGQARLVASLDIDIERNPRTDWVEAPKGVALPSRVLDMLGPSFEHTSTSSHRWFCETVVEVGDTITVIAFLDAQEGDVFRRPGVLELGADVVDCAFLGTAEELRTWLAVAVDYRRRLKLAYGVLGGILLLASVIVPFL